ncbi:HGGxSTG domain-containing protein [Priestia megaterium]|uniref:HGGxSTG domain-containing protein n=1 Tax=Priestia megaterium TaxID=1404 RepID=UPI001C54F0AF|nr:HGGxSTG domain-containing protein [Priestia megaterium]
MSKENEKLLEEVELVNNMKYPKSRKDRAESMRKQLSKVDIICGAIDRSKGKICSKPPVEGAKRCAQHGGLSTGAVTEEGKARALANLDPRASLIHGMYSQFVMTTEEQDFYVGFMNYYIEALDLDPMNILGLDRALRNFILNQRKEIAQAGEIVDESNSYNDYDTKFMRYMQTLGLDRKFNISNEHKDNNKSEASSITMLFMDDK